MTNSRPVALITGAGSGIGRAAALALSSADRGHHRIALVGRREEPLRETGALLGTEGEDWAALPTDIADPEQASGLPARAVKALGRLDAIVNNAGWTPMKPVWEHTPEEVAALFAVNATGPILISIAALKIFRNQNAGRLVQVSSMATDDPFPGLTVYGGAKAALNILSKGLANELDADGPIRVFTVAPGAVETELLRSIVPTDAMPTEACLTPESVGELIADCAAGKRDPEHGKTIWVPNG